MTTPMDSSTSDKAMTEANESPKVWTELKCGPNVSTDVSTDDSMAEWDDTPAPDNCPPEHRLQCLESGDGNDYSLMAVVNAERQQRPYCPSTESRQLHNHKERLRRSRMKCSCDALRALVPGLNDKTDKATVLEHTVHFLFHLSKCQGVKCEDYVPTTPPPMSAKLLDLYPTLMSGEYRYYESLENQDLDHVLDPNEGHVIEIHESNGTQYVTTADGHQYMIVDDGTGQSQGVTDGQFLDVTNIQLMDTSADNERPIEEPMVLGNGQAVEPFKTECHECVERVVDMLSDDKENIDPNGDQKPTPKRRGRKPKHKLLVDPCVDNGHGMGLAVQAMPGTGLRTKRKYKKRKPKAL